MNKIILSLIILTLSLFSSETKYLKEKDYNNNNFRIFIGTQLSYSYIKTNSDIDRSMFSYGLYLGLPIFSNYDIILKRKKKVIDEFYFVEDSLTLTIPLTSRLTSQTYVGVEAGKGKITWNDESINKYSLSNKTTSGNFYALSIGKKYKFTRNYYVRIELAYSKYDYLAKSSVEDIQSDYSVDFNYAFEYRF